MSEQLFRVQAVRYATEHDIGAPTRLRHITSVSVGLLFLGLLLVAIAFALVGTFPRTETVRGRVIPTEGLVRVQTPTSGVVEAISRREGDQVARGDMLLTLSNGVGIGNENGAEHIARGLRDESRAVTEGAAASLQDIDARIEGAHRSTESLASEIAQIRSQISTAEQLKALAAENLERAQTMAQAGYFPRAQVDERRVQLLNAEAALSAASQRLLALQRQQSEGLQLIETLSAQRRAAIAAADQQQAALSQRLASTLTQSQLSVRAPLDGEVSTLLFSVGQFVPAGGTVALINPPQSELVAEIYIPSRAIGFLREGQVVRLKYDAFPSLRHGAPHGRLISIASAPISMTESQLFGFEFDEPMYRARVRLNDQDMVAYGRRVPLRSGMLLSAEIVTDQATLLQWLLDPIRAVARR